LAVDLRRKYDLPAYAPFLGLWDPLEALKERYDRSIKHVEELKARRAVKVKM
jgi:hypothetical protein